MTYTKTPEQQLLDDAIRADQKTEVEKRIAIERKILRFVFKYVIKSGMSVSCFDGEEWYLKRCTKINTIMEEIQSVDEESFRFRKEDGTIFGGIVCIYGNGNYGYDVISDSTYNDEFNEWYKPIDEYIDGLQK
ncbi:hypothetical protein pEaSNUABM47_00033 [Erwinia phage pEa_SNUABM_47]|uniref:Uncharacterized protein n=1 Tax=Erwinia phage pEa_SNUABM_47 TaxID=2768774 RepID=A0A7L8ZMN0_9CAUD|nr:hypothetical protein pEaSNUABM47_00033 [Erwinia phage pEa_SNUABM_47]QXO11729.1 hypothetical protein pEaSNUABM44_00033 [Erwinia phage pEa_SNUABM_44]QXO12280.1 hypothetical protein pEaSNUABM49_00034 [Erwinia phage pEa_SNUABM_49]